jgi:hypothetical protein
MGHQRSIRGEHQDTILRRSPLAVPARTHRHDFWRVDCRRQRLERGALVVIECPDWFEVNMHRPSASAYSVVTPGNVV